MNSHLTVQLGQQIHGAKVEESVGEKVDDVQEGNLALRKAVALEQVVQIGLLQTVGKQAGQVGQGEPAPKPHEILVVHRGGGDFPVSQRAGSRQFFPGKIDHAGDRCQHETRTVGCFIEVHFYYIRY